MAIQAFPEAYGWGAESIGGRGGQVLEVTNLNASGPGSFREALETSGPRVIEFRVTGTIDIGDTKLQNWPPFLTIDGRTSSGGICIAHDQDFQVRDTHDIIIRYLRFRHNGASGNDDAFQVFNSYNVMVDHCSISWGTDEVMSCVQGSHHVTYQWCMIYEGIIGHNTAGLFKFNTHHVSLHHNLYAHCDERNPAVLDARQSELGNDEGYFEVVNNVIYNWNGQSLAPGGDACQVNIINNFWKLGPESVSYPTKAEIYANGDPKAMYLRGNIGPSNSDSLADNWDAGMVVHFSGTVQKCAEEIYCASDPVPVSVNPIPEEPALAAFESVLAGAGASNVRDTADARVVADVRAGTGRYISSPADVGGLPVLEEDQTTIVTDLEAVELSLRTQAGVLLLEADTVAQAIADLKVLDDTIDATADVIEAD